MIFWKFQLTNNLFSLSKFLIFIASLYDLYFRRFDYLKKFEIGNLK